MKQIQNKYNLKPKKTYALVRISSTTQSEKNGGTGVEYQTKRIKQYADLNDYDLGDIFVDEVSGAIAERDGIKKLTKLIS